MLNAVIGKKLRGRVKDLFHSDSSNSDARQILQEDVITSSVFGPLQYMDAASAWQAIERTFFRGDKPHENGAFQPVHHRLVFWPSLALKGRTRVEPDLIFEFSDAQNCCRIILLEVKWGADLSEEQLQAQRSATEKAYPGAAICQVLLAKEVSPGAQEQARATSCEVVKWHQLAGASNQKCAEITGIWIGQVEAFLARLGIVPFSGIKVDSLVNDDDARHVFDWRMRHVTFSFVVHHVVEVHSLSMAKNWRIIE